MIAGALASSFARKAKQSQSQAVQSANAKEGKGTSGDTGTGAGGAAAPAAAAVAATAAAIAAANLAGTDGSPPSQTTPAGTVPGTPSGTGGAVSYQSSLPNDISKGIELPSPPPKGYYQPSPICSTEELLGEVLGATINQITEAFGAANDTILSASNDGNNPDVESEVGEEPQKAIDMSISKRNVTAALKKGTLISGIAAAFATAVGVDKNVIGRVTRAFQQGQYGYGLEVMSTLANAVGTDVGRKRMLSNIMDQVASGDIAGGFSESANLFGIPVSLSLIHI